MKINKYVFSILFFLVFVTFVSVTAVFAKDEVSKKITEKLYSIGTWVIENFLSGDGDTEVSITAGDNIMPLGSV